MSHTTAQYRIAVGQREGYVFIYRNDTVIAQARSLKDAVRQVRMLRHSGQM